MTTWDPGGFVWVTTQGPWWIMDVAAPMAPLIRAYWWRHLAPKVKNVVCYIQDGDQCSHHTRWDNWGGGAAGAAGSLGPPEANGWQQTTKRAKLRQIGMVH